MHNLNLSSRPFRNRTLPWVLSALLSVVALFGAVFIFGEWRRENAKAALVKDGIAKIDPQIKAIKANNERIIAELTPEQKNILRSSHALVDRKRFAWSRLFADLENVLPRDVGVSRVSVNKLYRSGDKMVAELDFAVLSRDYQAVVTMLNEMNSSGIFNAELRGQDLQRDKGTLSEYTMRLVYSPRSGVPVAPNALENALTQTTENEFVAGVKTR